MALTETQELFLRWNAVRLGISRDESRKRYIASWSAIRGGHGGRDFKMYARLTHEVFRVFYDDAIGEIHDAYQFHGPLHFLRYLSYREPQLSDENIAVQKLRNRSGVTILDYGCGLAQESRSLAKYLNEKGTRTRLVLVDIPTERRDFLLWIGKETDLDMMILDATPNTPIPDLPPCDICIATEFFEHVHDPIRYFDRIHAALKPGGIFRTNVSDHERSFMHVSPQLGMLRSRIRLLNYVELIKDRLYQKSALETEMA